MVNKNARTAADGEPGDKARAGEDRRFGPAAAALTFVASLPALLFGCLILDHVAGAAQPQPPQQQGSGPQAQADEARGQQITIAGAGDKVPPCATCHGKTGIADGSGAFPRLAGQIRSYLYQQLKSFADGTRPNPIMSPISKALSDQDMRDLAAYYAAQHGPYFPQPFIDQPVLELGGRLAAIGQPQAGIQACFSCHGEAGKGSDEMFPYLAGQYQSYLAQQLRDFKSGRRHNDPAAVMRNIASGLNDGDIAGLSAYFGSIRPSCQCNEAASPAEAATASGPASPSSGSSGGNAKDASPSGEAGSSSSNH
jgi:cytochrome c553